MSTIKTESKPRKNNGGNVELNFGYLMHALSMTGMAKKEATTGNVNI